MNNFDKIIIQGAQENNLKNIDIEIPKNKLVVITGVSGSGKSSLAFDTIYAEGYRRYVENLSSSARFFLKSVKKPKVKKIINLSPSIAIDQKSGSQNPRSTVGTLTDLYDFFRHLYAQVGRPYCPTCGLEMKKQDLESIVDEIKSLPDNTQVAILGRWPKSEKSFPENILAIESLGYARARVDKKIITIRDLKANEEIFNNKEQEVDVVVDRINLNKNQFDRERIIDSLQTATKISKGQAIVLIDNFDEIPFNKYFSCPQCGYTIKNISARNFSFNSPEGACEKCAGLGTIAQVDVARIIPNKNLSVAEGAIVPWSRPGGRINGDSYYNQVFQGLSKKYNFSLKIPVEKIPAGKLEKILYGTGEEEIEIKDKHSRRLVKFEGVVKYLEEKYKKADSSFIRSEIERFMTIKVCPQCQGKRLKSESLNVKVFGKAINEVVSMEIIELVKFLKEEAVALKKDKEREKKEVNVSLAIINEIINRLEPLIEVGLSYLNLDRSCTTLSGGEFQRTRLATQLYSGLSGVIYVLDEPSIGLHSRDNERLIKTLKRIKDNGNTVIVVEHDKDMIKNADYVIDVGPGAGENGGQVIFKGELKKLKKAKTETAQYLTNKKKFKQRHDKAPIREKLIIKGAVHNNLKNIDVAIPLKKLVVAAGVSGSGKSSLVNDILAKALRKELSGSYEEPGIYKSLDGVDKISKVVIVDQSPIGKSPRSNAATYTGVFNFIRDLFANTQLAKEKGYTASHFSFNMRGGRCEYCQGEGVKKIEMHLLSDVYAVCGHCQGKRYSKKILDVQYHGANIAEVLDMNVEYAFHFFTSHKIISEKLDALRKVGLGYLRLGQSATELSGGEAQRVKLATELSRKSKGNTLYILDEPTVGLHFSDIARLLEVLQNLVNKGNSVLVVEHNVDVIKASDWVIELGPEGGKEGGELIFEGTPDDLKKAKTWTAKFLK